MKLNFTKAEPNGLFLFAVPKLSRKITLILFFSFLCYSGFAQKTESAPGIITVCPHGEFDGHHHTPPADWIREKLESSTQSLIGDDPCSSIEVTYINFPPAAEAAFQAAIDIWETVLSSPVTMRVEATWAPLAVNTLGQAGPTNVFRNFPNAPTDDYYAGALADQIAGYDLLPGAYDINATFNSQFDWYYGVDGNTPFNQVDLVSIVLHEIGHGLGFLSSKQYNTATGVGSLEIGTSGIPINYDNFLTLGSFGTPLVNLSGVALGNALVSDNVYNNSALAITANGGTAPRIYAPTTYAAGSSTSHWNESTFATGTVNSLMTPSLNYGEAIHNPGDITIGLLEDMGWTICYDTDFCPDLGLSIGDACDDGNPGTTGDIVNGSCECIGTSSISNDTPCEASTIVANGTIFLSSNVGATVDAGEIIPPAGTDVSGTCLSQDGWCASGLNLASTVWFTVIAPPSGRITVSTCNTGTTIDTQLALYSATNCNDYSTFSLVGANDDLLECAQAYASSVTACVNPGETYYIQVDGFSTSTGAIAIVATEENGIGCSGDGFCLNEIPYFNTDLDGLNELIEVTTCIYEEEYSTFHNAIQGYEYQFTSSGLEGGFMTVRSGSYDGSVIGSGYSPLNVISDIAGSLYVHYTLNENCETNAECVTATVQCLSCPPPFDCPSLNANIGDACDDGNIDTENDTVTINCECVGTIVYDCPELEANIGDACDDGNSLTLNDVILGDCSCAGVPNNDDCDNPTLLLVNEPGDCLGNETIGTTVGANISPGFDCESNSPDVFYTFNAGSYENVLINLANISAADLVISVLQESCGATAIVQCSIGLNQTYEVAVNPGLNYIIRIHSFTLEDVGDFNICVEGVENDYGFLSGFIDGWNNNCAARNMVISLYNLESGNLSSITTTLNQDGTFDSGTLEITPGTFDILIKVEGALAKLTESVEFNSGTNSFIFEPIILGDLNNANLINVVDFSLIAAEFGSGSGDPDFNYLADLNCDGIINVVDFSIISSSFGVAGDNLNIVN